MGSPNYVWEKMYVAIGCMCSDGSFTSRLENATISALTRLEENDLTGKLGEDLKYILGWTKKNIVGGKIQRDLDELERNKLVEKMLHIMLETYKK